VISLPIRRHATTRRREEPTVDITFTPDFAVDDATCKAATGKTFDEWAALIDERGLGGKRRDAIQLIYDQNRLRAKLTA
jgi:hypothetical protein